MTNGYFCLQQQATILQEMAQLTTCDPADVPDKSKFLLEAELLT
jgi:hypothetical protein